MRERVYDADALCAGLGKLKGHLRITSSDLDNELLDKLQSAVESAEHFVGRTIFPSRFSSTLPFSSSVQIGRPLLSVDSVVLDGVPVSPDGYAVDARRGVLAFPEGTEGTDLLIGWTAGMRQVPADMMNAILLHASSLFCNVTDSVETLPKASSRLLRPYRTYGL